MPKTKRAYRKNRTTSGIKETDNLFMDGWSWRRFNNTIDAEMTKRGLPPSKTPTTLSNEVFQG